MLLNTSRLPRQTELLKMSFRLLLTADYFIQHGSIAEGSRGAFCNAIVPQLMLEHSSVYNIHLSHKSVLSV